MTIPLLAQAIAAQAVAATAKANGEKEGKNVDDSDEVTKLSNTMAFLNGKPDATAQVDVKNFIRACKRHEAIKHIVLHWRRRKKHRLAAQSMQLCKRWINFPLVRFTYIHVCMPHAGSTGPRILLAWSAGLHGLQAATSSKRAAPLRSHSAESTSRNAVPVPSFAALRRSTSAKPPGTRWTSSACPRGMRCTSPSRS